MHQNIEQIAEHAVARSTFSDPSIQSLWESDINWDRAEKYVRRLQERIYQNTKSQQWLKVRNLQKLLARSYNAKVIENIPCRAWINFYFLLKFLQEAFQGHTSHSSLDDFDIQEFIDIHK